MKAFTMKILQNNHFYFHSVLDLLPSVLGCQVKKKLFRDSFYQLTFELCSISKSRKHHSLLLEIACLKKCSLTDDRRKIWILPYAVFRSWKLRFRLMQSRGCSASATIPNPDWTRHSGGCCNFHLAFQIAIRAKNVGDAET